MDFETALNGCLPPYHLHIELLGSSVIYRAVILENPRCCGEADTSEAAIELARREYSHFLDEQAALHVRTLLSQGSVEAPVNSPASAEACAPTRPFSVKRVGSGKRKAHCTTAISRSGPWV